jgi:hypothetical protein
MAVGTHCEDRPEQRNSTRKTAGGETVMPNENEKRRQDQNQGSSPDKSGGGVRPRPDDPSRRQDFNYDDEPNKGKTAGSGKQPSGPNQPWQDRDEGNTDNSKQ